MKRNSKLAILIIIVTVAIFVWIPKGKKTKDVSTTSSVTLVQAIPVTRAVPRKRTEFVDWPRDPFAKPQIEEKKVGSVFDLKLSAIMWGDKKPSAFINGSLVSVGDKIGDKTVKEIGQNTVILTDGTNDYVLEMQH